MDTMETMQELFDTYANIPAPALCMMHDLEKMQEKHLDHIKAHGLTDEVFDEYADIAARYGVAYAHPKYARGLSVAKPSATVH